MKKLKIEGFLGEGGHWHIDIDTNLDVDSFRELVHDIAREWPRHNYRYWRKLEKGEAKNE